MELRDSQAKAWQTLKDVDFGILNAPTGWGKSLTLATVVGSDKRVVVAIPQKVIAKGFIRELEIGLPNGERLDYKVTHNLCDGLGGQKLKLLKSWLTSGAEGIIVTTHQALAMLWGEFSENEKIAAVAGTTFVLDEAHHVHSGEEAFNQLGAMVRWILENADFTRLLLATAFFFRGDELPIVSEKYINRFARFFVPFDEWWASLKHLKTYRYDFVAYKGTPWKEINALLDMSAEPTLFFVPWEGHRVYHGNSKQAFVTRLMKTIKQKTGATEWTGGIPKGKVILNFVENEYRAEKVRFVFEHGDKVAAIITVGMFREGADWIQCSRVIDIIPTSSNQDRLQRFGRLIRDFEGKKAVAYYSLFPHISDHPKEKQREELTRLYAHFHASLVLENALCPIKIPMPPSRQVGPDDERGRPINLLGEYDEQTQENILIDVHGQLITLAESGAVEPSAAQTAVEKVLKEYGIKQHLGPMAKQIILILRRKANAHLPVQDLVKAGFDKVWHDEATKGLMLYSAGVGGPDNFKEIWKIILSVFDARWLENYESIKQLPSTPPRNTRAGWWVAKCREFKTLGSLSAERQHLLEAIPWWHWTMSFTNRWQSRFDEIQKLSGPPNCHTPVGQWMRNQIVKYNSGKMSKQHVEMFKTIPWWTWGKRQDWENGFERLKKHVAKPPYAHKDWAIFDYNRQRLNKGKLTTEQKRKLLSLKWFKEAVS